MPYKNKEDKKRRDKEYYQRNREEIKQKTLGKYYQDRAKIRKRRKELNTSEKRAKNAERERLRYSAYRKIVLNAYGAKCACCGEDEPLFLEIDHVNNDGKKHRNEIGNSSKALVYWLIQNNFPDGFQILCSNCNQGKKRNKGICPHKQRKDQ